MPWLARKRQKKNGSKIEMKMEQKILVMRYDMNLWLVDRCSEVNK